MPDKKTIKNLEEYYERLQTIQIDIESENSVIDRIVQKHVTKPDFYTLAGVRSLRKELEQYLIDLTKRTGDTGKLMAQKAMTRFLEESELRDITRKQLRAINQLNTRQIARRIDLMKMRIEKETVFFKSQVDEFLLNAKISGRTNKDVLKELIKAAGDKQGLSAGFTKKIKRVAIDAERREAQQRAMMEYRKLAQPGEKYEWITVSSTPCPDCQARAGVILPWDVWEERGTPGSGRTICGESCKCQLIPETLSEEMFPDAKSFTWDRDKLVLTTAREARTFETHGKG